MLRKVVLMPLCMMGVQAQGSLLSDLKGMFAGKAADPGAGQVPANQQAAAQAALAAQQQQGQPGQPGQPAQQEADLDLLCLTGPQAQIWFNMQQKSRYIMPAEAAFAMVNKTEVFEPALMSLLEDMSQLSPENRDQCGVGKMLVQLLSILVNDNKGELIGKQIESNEPLTSPMLTLLLDIPWNNYQPMWPYFGFLAQMAIKRVQSKQNDITVDGLQGPELQQFLNAFDVSIVNGDLNSIKSLAEAYLATGDDGVRESPIAFITALFAKAATSEQKEEVQELFFAAQGVIKKMVFRPQDLDTLLSTRWPLWGFAYLASLKTAF